MAKSKSQKHTTPVDLSEYAEEKIPFDDVIRKIGHAKPQHKSSPKKKAKKSSK